MGTIVKPGYIILPTARFVAGISGGSMVITLPLACVVLEVFVITPTNHSILGMTGGEDGRWVWVANGSSLYTLTTAAESGGASAADRFVRVHAIPPDEMAPFIYDGAVSRWISAMTS